MLPPIPAARDFPGSPWQKPPLHSMGDAVRGRHDQVSVPVLCTATGERRATTGTRSPRSRRHPKRPPRTAARGTPSRFYSSLHPWQWRFRFAVPVSPRSRGAAIGPILARPTGFESVAFGSRGPRPQAQLPYLQRFAMAANLRCQLCAPPAARFRAPDGELEPPRCSSKRDVAKRIASDRWPRVYRSVIRVSACPSGRARP